jgi:hypothetical protein
MKLGGQRRQIGRKEEIERGVAREEAYLTRKDVEELVRPEEVGRRRISRRSAPGMAGERRTCVRLRASWSDSLHQKVELDDAVLGVVSEWRGEVWGGGAMVRMVVAGLLRLLTEKRRKIG